MKIFKKIMDYLKGDDLIEKYKQDRKSYIASLDTRQQELFTKLVEEDPPISRYVMTLEKRIYDLEQKNND